MFETAQQEPSAGTGKIIGGVIAILLVALVVLYFLYFRQEPAATPAAGTGAATAGATAATGGEAPDPMRDLTISKFNLGRDQTQTMALWDIQLANRSRSHAYKNIQYATNYYNAEGALLYHNEGTLSEQLEPGDQRNISQINDGLYPVGTVRYTIELKGAEAVQP